MTDVTSLGILENQNLTRVGGILGLGAMSDFWLATSLDMDVSALVTPNVTEYAWLNATANET